MNDVLGVGKAVEKIVDPVVSLLMKIAGPAADEVGLTLQDRVHVYRAKQAYRLAEKFKKFCDEKGLAPGPISLKLLLPILDGASIEDNEDLHTMWAALLANATSNKQLEVLPSFPDVLRQLTGNEALYFKALCAQGQPAKPEEYSRIGIAFGELYKLYCEVIRSDDASDYVLLLDDLLRLGLIAEKTG